MAEPLLRMTYMRLRDHRPQQRRPARDRRRQRASGRSSARLQTDACLEWCRALQAPRHCRSATQRGCLTRSCGPRYRAPRGAPTTRPPTPTGSPPPSTRAYRPRDSVSSCFSRLLSHRRSSRSRMRRLRTTWPAGCKACSSRCLPRGLARFRSDDQRSWRGRSPRIHPPH